MRPIADALTNRHDITAQRHPVVIPGSQPGMDVAQELTRVLGVLTDILKEPNVSEEFVVMNMGSNVPAEYIEPHKGLRRTIAQRTAIGPENYNIPQTGAAIYADNPNRFGGQIINTHATSPLLLVLGVDVTGLSGSPFEGARNGYGTLWLSPGGGSWNFKLTDVLWAGSVYGFGVSATVTIEATEV